MQTYTTTDTILHQTKVSSDFVKFPENYNMEAKYVLKTFKSSKCIMIVEFR